MASTFYEAIEYNASQLLHVHSQISTRETWNTGKGVHTHTPSYTPQFQIQVAWMAFWRCSRSVRYKVPPTSYGSLQRIIITTGACLIIVIICLPLWIPLQHSLYTHIHKKKTHTNITSKQSIQFIQPDRCHHASEASQTSPIDSGRGYEWCWWCAAAG